MAKSRKKPVHKQKQTQERIEKDTDGLTHPNPLVRTGAWSNLGQIFRGTPDSVTTGLISHLLARQSHEKDQDVWRTAAHTISEAFLRMSRTEERCPGEHTLDGLGDWLWKDFHEPSRVLRVADPERLRRDEAAVIEIARSLPLAGFPLTEFICVDPGGFAPLLADYEEIKALCFVGRLCLYGEDAVRMWGPKTSSRYRFGRDLRPPGLAPGQLDPEYHSVVVHACEPGGTLCFQAMQSRQTRTDYGLIRRYVVPWGGSCRVVIQIAGCSSLGTLGAAHFAACTLFHRGFDGKPLPLPPRVPQQSQLEALVEVTADTRGCELGWRLQEFKLLDLRVGGFDWDQEHYCWRHPAHELITVVFRDASAKRTYRSDDETAVEVLVDGRALIFRGKSENRRLCIALALLASSQRGQVELKQLAKDTWIWNDGTEKSIEHVKTRLNNLHRHLGRSIAVGENTCRVFPPVRIEVRQPAPA